MAELARVHRIKVILGSILPVCDCFTVKTDTRPAARIIALNEWIRGYCKRSGFVYVDYFHSVADVEGHLRRELTTDGVHLNAKGYGIITPLAQNAIAAAAEFTQ